MKEKDIFNENRERKKASYTCPKCGQTNDYEVTWIRRIKKKHPPKKASYEDMAKFNSAQNYIIRLDDKVTCKNTLCRKRFDIPDSKSMYFI